MSEATDNFQRELAKMRERFAIDLAGKLTVIADDWTELQSGGGEEVLERLHRNVHSLAGSGGTFGFGAVGDKARTFEIMLKSLIQERKALHAADVEEGEKLFQELSRAAAQAAGQADSPHPRNAPPEKLRTEPTRSDDQNTSLRRAVLVVSTDEAFTAMLKSYLSQFGYTCKTAAGLDDLEKLIQAGPVLAVLFDCDVFPGGGLARQPWRDTHTPLIMMSCRDDMESRLSGTRYGAVDYFVKPVDLSRLLDRLETLDVQTESDLYRVLIVDDDTLVAKRHELILQNQGLLTRVLPDPMRIMELLEEFTPDLVLLDVYMPGCSGMEVAEVVRQKPEYLGLPILFLSAETEATKQFLAVSHGGDDFLTKPIEPDNLIRSVMDRIRRYRSVRSMMVRDGLTKLLNHTNMKQQIKIELDRARRHQNLVGLCILDLDHFKSINDTFGHPAGDVVLKNLARLLTQSLRRSDIAGRVGGEEFAVLLRDIDSIQAAWTVMDRLREKFSALVHSGPWGEVRVTFSCGMAFFPDYADENLLNAAADMALYEAKKGGRNKVVINRAGSIPPS